MSAFAGYEYEDWLLNQWGIWARGGGFTLSGSGSGDPDERCAADDSTMERVDSTVARMDREDKRLIKQKYLCRNHEATNDLIRNAVRRFAYCWE